MCKEGAHKKCDYFLFLHPDTEKYVKMQRAIRERKKRFEN